MRTTLLYVLIAILFLTSACSFNDKDPEPEKTYLLQRKYSEVILKDGNGGTIDLTYTYNDDNQLTNISGVANWGGELKTVYTTLAYNGKGRVERINTLTGTEWLLYYNDKDQIEKVTRSYQGTLGAIYMHHYDEKGRLSGMNIYSGSVSEKNLGSQRLITYPSSNQIKIAIHEGNRKSKEYILLTDNKKRNLPALPHQISFDFSTEELMSERLITQNNIESFEQLNFNNTTGASNKSGLSYQAAYTYNGDGYVTTCVKSYDEGSIQKVTYTYSVK